MKKIKEVLEFKALVSETKGRFVIEKIYHGALDEDENFGGGCIMWCVWNPEKKKWSKWHVRYFIIGDDRYFSDNAEFRFYAAEYKRYGTLSVAK